MDWERDGITRRAALARGFGGIALVCSFDFDKRARPERQEDERVHARVAPSSPFEPFQRDLPIPPVARPVARDREARAVRVHDEAGHGRHPARAQTPVLGYNGLFPGPTIKATRGRAVEVRQINQSGRSLNVHLHGGVTRPQFDGHPHDAIPHGDGAALQVPERRSARRRSGTTTTRTARRRRRCSPGWPAFYLLDDPDDTAARPAAGRLRRPADDHRTARSTPTARSATGSTSTAASAATRSWSTARSRRG